MEYIFCGNVILCNIEIGLIRAHRLRPEISGFARNMCWAAHGRCHISWRVQREMRSSRTSRGRRDARDPLITTHDRVDADLCHRAQQRPCPGNSTVLQSFTSAIELSSVPVQATALPCNHSLNLMQFLTH